MGRWEHRSRGGLASLRAISLVLATALSVLLGITWSPGGRVAQALPKFDPFGPDLEGGYQTILCEDLPGVAPELELVGTPRIVGYPVVGFTVEIDAREMKLRGRLTCGGQFVHPIDDFAWSLESQPAGSTTVLTDTEFLAPHLRLDLPGTYVVRLTACPEECTVESPWDSTGEFASTTIVVSILAVSSAPLAPETTPVRPSLQPTLRTPQAQNHCSFDASVTSAQWFAVSQINGPGDYRQLEGVVSKSRVARYDTPMNHDSQDVNFRVEPDEQYRHLLFEGSEESTIEVEWEKNVFPELYWPTLGDRVSVFGHWIYDCPHDSKSEIHPPVGVAVHRARAISIPFDHTFPELGNQRVGSGVYVPGVVTDMFFSVLGGRLLDCSVDTGLKNADKVPGPGGVPVATCVPPASLDRVFEFNIYLPPNPWVTMTRAGFAHLPPVPLYVGVSTPPNMPTENPPDIQRIDTSDGITYLKVRLDLRGYATNRYFRRIVAGWVLPAADNWGLARWLLRLKRIEVFDDSDGAGRGDGEWRLWINTNNAVSDWPSLAPRQEWVQILNQDVHDTLDYTSDPWQTVLGPLRSLGPELLRYPVPGPLPGPRDYGILFHSTGYEADGAVDDDAGTISIFMPAVAASYRERNVCTGEDVPGPLLYSGCASYAAEFEIARGTPLPAATLSTAAQTLISRYVLSCASGEPADDVGVCEGVLARPVDLPTLDPWQIVLDPGSGPVDITAIGPYRPSEPERGFTHRSSEDFYRIVTETQRTDPARVDRLLTAVRRYINQMRSDPGLSLDAQSELVVIEASLPPDLWARYFGDIPRPGPDPALPRTRLTGSGAIAHEGAQVQVNALLNCAVLRLPNSLALEWASNRFDLDLSLDASCITQRPAASTPFGRLLSWLGLDSAQQDAVLRVQRGRGLGRYNGRRGASIEWQLVDGGEPGAARDGVRVTVRSGEVIVLNASGRLVLGDLQAHWEQ
jgi:hypothetical protein